jgi:hypothetical protein
LLEARILLEARKEVTDTRMKRIGILDAGPFLRLVIAVSPIAFASVIERPYAAATSSISAGVAICSKRRVRRIW